MYRPPPGMNDAGVLDVVWAWSLIRVVSNDRMK